MVTWAGSIIVPKVSIKIASRPRYLNRAKEYATTEEERMPPAVLTTTTFTLFSVHAKKGTFSTTRA